MSDGYNRFVMKSISSQFKATASPILMQARVTVGSAPVCISRMCQGALSVACRLSWATADFRCQL